MLTIRVPGGQWVPVDWQVCLEMGWMAIALASRVKRRRLSRRRIDGSIVLDVRDGSLPMGTVYGGFTILL